MSDKTPSKNGSGDDNSGLLGGWRPMKDAIKDGECDRILLRFSGGEVSVGYWDLYYAEGGRGYEGGLAWIEPCSGERLDLHYGDPIGWLPTY